ncbi:serine acetyltransferase [Ilyomonas limi]|uniref:Serine acetyltransferase n=1 Tax=Ilyomonas limi TaxID=2575867 RepID=A0A4U3L4P4_9BACT|nr:serine O-acetyltransferase EpsC [Ilyomonas limi]TKK69912.1 serine acetyltransferase [Ilyomonas limi]
MHYQYPGFILNNTLPSKKQVNCFIEGLTHYVFPVTQEPQAFLQHHEQQCGSLQSQLTRLLALVDKNNSLQHDEIITTYFDSLCGIKDTLLKDAQLILDFDPAATSLEEIIICYPGFQAITVHRLSHPLYKMNVPILPRMMNEWVHSQTGIDINPGATIGSPFFIDHGTGVVIGETAVIGNNVKIYQGVTLGALAVRKEDATRKRHPTVQDNVVIYAGSTILGGSTIIGHDSIIGGNTWLTHSIPAHSVVYHQHQTVVKDSKDFEEPINFVI